MTTTTTIRVTPEFAASVAAIVDAGKTPWLIINGDYAVGAYAGRNEARAAKTADKLEGTVVKASEVTVEVVALTAPAKKQKPAKATKADPAAKLTAQEQAKIDEKGNPLNCRVCPKCGSEEIYHGRNDGGLVVDEDCCGGCHHCDWEFNFGILRKSEIESPCFVVWDTADKMIGARRKDVIAACVAKGVAFYTARTQYQLWLTAVKNDQATRAAHAAKSKK